MYDLNISEVVIALTKGQNGGRNSPPELRMPQNDETNASVTPEQALLATDAWKVSVKGNEGRQASSMTKQVNL